MNKIFGIGLNKTGTRSLASALRILGFRTLHKGDRATSELVHRASREGRPLLTHVGEQYDAYLDVHALVERFVEADRHYPDSRFIYTTRELEAWLDSRERHVRGNQQQAAVGGYAGSWLTVDREAWVRRRRRHEATVRRHFQNRARDLLVMDITAGDGWDVLAPFLGCRIPDAPFPWENRGGQGTYAGQRRASLPRRFLKTFRRVRGRAKYRMRD